MTTRKNEEARKTMTTHEAPTHLHVEDQILAGLTVRQLLYLVVGGAAAYGLWHNAGLPLAPRAGCAALAAAAGLALALLRPAGQPLATWLALLAVYATTSRHVVWGAAAEGTPPVRASRPTPKDHPVHPPRLMTGDAPADRPRAA